MKLYSADYNEMVARMPPEWHEKSRNNLLRFPTQKGFKEVSYFIDKYAPESILDYGCGNCKALDQFSERCIIDRYDPFIPEIAELPTRKSDLVICYNVLNVVEDVFLERVIERVVGFANKAALFHIMTPGLYYRNAATYVKLLAKHHVVDINIVPLAEETTKRFIKHRLYVLVEKKGA